MKLLIVDDEAPARAKLRRLLSAQPDIDALFEAADASEALAVLTREPDLHALILDIQMPGLSGLELALQRPEGVACIFCTAYDAHAVQAFELHAVDYLLKPFSPERLATALQRLRERLAARPTAAPTRQRLLSALQQIQPSPGHWLVQRQGRLIKLPLAQIEWVASADNYIEMHAPPESYLERRSLSAFLEHPAAQGFVRVHRCHAVQAVHIVALQTLPHGEALLQMRSGQQLRLSRSYRESSGLLPEAG